MDKIQNKTYLYLLQLLSCCMLIINRISYEHLTKIPQNFSWYILIILYFLTNTAIPLFLMTSGALLLGVNEDYKKNFNRIFKLLLLLVLFSFFYYMLETKPSEWFVTFNLISLSKTVWSSEVTVTFRYLYLYISIFIMLPLLRKMIQNFSHMDYTYFISCIFLFAATFPMAMLYFSVPNLNELVKVPMFSSYLGYFILGYFFEKVWNIYRKNLRNFMIIMFSIFMGISIYLTIFEYNKHSADFLFWGNIRYITTMVPSISLFYLFKYENVHNPIERKKAKILKWFSGSVLGIFLFSDLFIGLFSKIEFFNKLAYPVLSVALLFILVFSAGFILTLILKKIPVISKLFDIS